MWSCEELTGVSASEVEIKSHLQFYTGIKSHDIQETLIKSACDLITEETPNYQYVAGRLITYHLRKMVYGQFKPWPLMDIIKKNIGEMSNLLRRKRIINVKSETGTNVTFEVNWREWKLDDNGICNRPRMLTNLPAGKIFTLPREGTMNGTIVIDGSWDSDLVDEPVFLHIENGLVVDVKGGTAAAQIRQTFGEAARRLKSKDQENVWTIAEFGFGMNPNARVAGNVLEDEKRLGTAYFSIGDNTTLGGTAAVGIQISGVLERPSIWMDETLLFEEGQFVAH